MQFWTPSTFWDTTEKNYFDPYPYFLLFSSFNLKRILPSESHSNHQLFDPKFSPRIALFLELFMLSILKVWTTLLYFFTTTLLNLPLSVFLSCTSPFKTCSLWICSPEEKPWLKVKIWELFTTMILTIISMVISPKSIFTTKIFVLRFILIYSAVYCMSPSSWPTGPLYLTDQKLLSPNMFFLPYSQS